MTLLSLPALTPPEIYVIGDVLIHDRAVVAAGSVLQATLGHQIVIEEGACIGMGTVINASEGEIIIGKGVIVGSGVLIVGSGHIGCHACIGSASTLWNTSVEAMAVIPPGSLLGDLSQPIPRDTLPGNGKVPDSVIDHNISASVESDPWETSPNEISPPATKPPVVGEVYINQMLYALFPGRKPPPNT